MTLEEALYAHLSNVARFTGAIVGTRIYPQIIPQGVPRPAIAYQRVSRGERQLAHDGPIGFGRATIQITCQGKEYRDAKPLAQAVRKDLNGYKGLLGGAGGVAVGRCAIENEIDGDAEFDANTVRMDFSFLYEE